MEPKLHVSKATEIAQWHPDTIGRLEKKGPIKAIRDYGGFRAFKLEDLLKLKAQRA
jgi:DNA-binding transcriptional MerR regulator